MVFRCATLLLALLLSISTPLWAAPPRNLSAEEARRLLASGGKVHILDVRTPGEFRDLRLEGARLVPIDQLQRRVGEIPRDVPVLIYCAVGSRSSQGAHFLARQGFSVYNLFGGIYAWQLRGYPVVRGAP